MALTVILPSGLSNTGNFSVGSVNATGNLSGGNISAVGNINVGGNLSAVGNINIGGNLVITGNITDITQIDITTSAGNANIVLTPNGTGNVNTPANVSVTGSIIVNSGARATAIVNGAGNAVGNIGSSSTYFNQLFAQATTALYADLAEMYTTDAEYAPGTVLIFGGNQEVTISTATHDNRVAGVVSTNPAHVMNSGLQGEFTVAVALTGRVPVSVIGNITAGDRVVTSNHAGVAEALDITRYQPGVIIGKALQGYSGHDVGVIEVVVGRL